MTITHALESTGTDFGIHSLIDLAYGCSRKVYLQQIDKEQETDSEREIKSKSLLTGTIVHAYLEEYFRAYPKRLDIEDIELVPPMDTIVDVDLFDTCVAEGKRLATAFISNYPPNCFGTPIAVEKAVEFLRPKEGFLLPTPYTGRLDLVTKVTAKDAKRIRDLFAIRVTPGIYLIDHKTTTRLDEITCDQILSSVQGVAYLHAYNHTPGVTPAKGVLYNFISKTKTPVVTVIPSNLKFDFQEEILGGLAKKVKGLWPITNKSNIEKYPKNPTRCWDWYRQCYYKDACYRSLV